MGLYDIMDEIAARQVTKTETGDNRIMGVVVGIVAKNYSDKMPGRVCVQIPVRDDDANELKWARVAMPSSGKSWGHYFLPEVGDQVLIVFEQGNIEKPYIIGCVPKETDKFLTGSVDKQNQIKRIVTRNGSTIEFDDIEDQQGENMDRLSVYTSKKAHKLLLDNGKKQITLADKDEKNKVVLKTETGSIEISAEHKVNIKVGENVELTLNGDSGTVSVKCSKLDVDATEGINLKANTRVSVSGGNVKVEASSLLKLESSGMAKLAGSPVKIG